MPAALSTSRRSSAPLLRPEAGERPDDRNGAEPWAELDPDRLDVRHRLERGNLAALRLGVREELRHVLIEGLHPDHVGEHLPKRLVNGVGGTLGEPLAPGAELRDGQPVDAEGAESAGSVQQGPLGRVAKAGLEGADRVRLRNQRISLS